jgi:hypothetical protein
MRVQVKNLQLNPSPLLPNDIDITGASTAVAFELVVSHPAGIDAISTMLTLKNSRNDTLATYLTRTDSNLPCKSNF